MAYPTRLTQEDMQLFVKECKLSGLHVRSCDGGFQKLKHAVVGRGVAVQKYLRPEIVIGEFWDKLVWVYFVKYTLDDQGVWRRTITEGVEEKDLA